MLNKVQDGKSVKLPVGSALTAGTYVQVGKLNAVLINDADASNDAVCDLEGVFNLSVDATGTNVAVGDYVYTSDGSAIDDVNTGDIVGTALAASSTVAVIPVRLHN